MSLELQDIEHIARLARLAVSHEDAPGYRQDLNNILHLVEQMNQLDTQGVNPLAHPLELTQRLRPDQVTESNQRDALQAIAPQTQEGLYLVPKVIE